MPTTRIRRATVAAAGAAALLGGAFAPSASAAQQAPASSNDWRCSTSQRTVDDPSTTGFPLFWLDDVTFTVKTCIMRSGGRVGTYSKLSWDNYTSASTNNLYDMAYGRQFVKKVDFGSNIIKCRRPTSNIEGAIGKPGTSGSITSKGLGCSVGRYAVGDFELWLDWGDGVQRKVEFASSPSA